MKQFYKKPVIANISGFSFEEFEYSCEKIDKADNVGIIEVNIIPFPKQDFFLISLKGTNTYLGACELYRGPN